MSECVEEVLKDIEMPKTIKKEVTFEDRSISVFMDFHQLYSVVRNIVLNAVQAMQAEGKLTINVFLSNKGSIVKIRICDTGKGIIKNARNKIFNLFYSTKIMGTGLGLPISKSIIEASQGELHLEETSEKGTCFIISLPLAKTSKEATKE